MLTLGEDLDRILCNNFARIGVEDTINDQEKKKTWQKDISQNYILFIESYKDFWRI